jgi:hypothetical protein
MCIYLTVADGIDILSHLEIRMLWQDGSFIKQINLLLNKNLEILKLNKQNLVFITNTHKKNLQCLKCPMSKNEGNK